MHPGPRNTLFARSLERATSGLNFMKRRKDSKAPIDVVGATTLSQSGVASEGYAPRSRRIPAAAIAARLVQAVRNGGAHDMMFIARSENQAEEVSISFKHFMPQTQVILLPPWDCLPYDRIEPSRESMGRRATALLALAKPANGRARLVVMSPEAALQRIPPAESIAKAFTYLAIGDHVDVDAFCNRLVRHGYLMDDRVDEPGEFALLGQGIEVFPSGAPHPYRILIERGVVDSIRSYNPGSQRTDECFENITLAPSTEVLECRSAPVEPTEAQCMEMQMVGAGFKLNTIFELLPHAPVAVEASVDERFDAAIALIDDARRMRDRQQGRKPTAERFYLDRPTLDKQLAKRRMNLDLQGLSSTPDFIVEINPARAMANFIADQVQAGRRVAVAGPSPDLDRMVRALQRHLTLDVGDVESWAAALGAEPATLVSLDVDIDGGFVDEMAALAVVSAADVFGTRLNPGDRGAPSLAQEPELRIGDVVLHEDHGIAVLRDLETVEVEGNVTDTVRLEYHGGATILAPVEEFGRIWRYGADEDAVTLDRLKGDGWAKRRAQLDIEIAEAAQHLIRLAAERESTGARALKPPRVPYARFAARFPYPETADQADAIAAVIADLSSGKAMNRLICGDVGFGKTEVALRAAAVVALNGLQVAVVAPTTVLARQHFETFSRRFEGTEVSVALLSRVVGDAQSRKVKAGLADGSFRIVVGTHAIAAKDVTFADLGLLIIDEEHRFGVKLKQTLRGLGQKLHVLSMSATPIPRTLAAAMVGVQEASLLSTPPARRRPVRTELAPFDRASLKTALTREHRRAGQSFCVVPRIEDIEPTLAELRKLVPDLSVLVAHGDMNPSEMDEAIVTFANGDGDILLSTNIIENGLDVPRANTIVVFRADRFGMAQLHQLRGRVGRGRLQGLAYLLTEAGKEISPETRSRLSTLLAFDRLGSGFAISARDLDLRGAGDLVGEEQAGHMKLIGLGLYQRLLARAVDKVRGSNAGSTFETEIELQFSGTLAFDYAPEPVVRLNLYSRLQRFETLAEIDAFAEELEDRFGKPPPETTMLIDLARLKLAAVNAGISKIGAGPVAIAIEFVTPGSTSYGRLAQRPDCVRRQGRLIFKIATQPGPQRLAAVQELVLDAGAL
ncbi:hypothetical protein B5V01_28585 [Mesorhizobium erdmanii]|uniref:Transcription-repair-coupling factor n=3 Tax=Phyllobacteriaceae TaxID=69277 RepID=A0A3M9X4H6_9HYPH|nr:DEAD/DEAH box helicase [Mesorhizobium japonicum]RXT37386.1 hypothetical protein B5V01_28585 [Mesorhizobium erdmanii]